MTQTGDFEYDLCNQVWAGFWAHDGLTIIHSESEGPLGELATSQSTCLCSRITRLELQMSVNRAE
jgi:hypothetical protein